MPEEFLFSLFQLVDSAFPVGGFSHSAGLEAAVHAGLVRPGDRAGLEAFLRSHALCVQHGQLPFVGRAVAAAAALLDGEADAAAARAGFAEDLLELSATLAGNRAALATSRSMGRALARLVGRFDVPPAAAAFLAGLSDPAAEEAPIEPHFAPLFGFLAGSLGHGRVPPGEGAGGALGALVEGAFWFAASRDVVSAATRLNVLGPQEAVEVLQRLKAFQAEARRDRADRAERAEAEGSPGGVDASPASASPLVELLQSSHGELCSKLFNS